MKLSFLCLCKKPCRCKTPAFYAGKDSCFTRYLSWTSTPLKAVQMGITTVWLSSLDTSEKYLEGNLGLEAAITVSSLGQLGKAKDRGWWRSLQCLPSKPDQISWANAACPGSPAGVGTAVVGCWSVSRFGLVCGAAHWGLCASDSCCHCLSAGASLGIAQQSWGSKIPSSFGSQQEKHYH